MKKKSKTITMVIAIFAICIVAFIGVRYISVVNKPLLISQDEELTQEEIEIFEYMEEIRRPIINLYNNTFFTYYFQVFNIYASILDIFFL